MRVIGIKSKTILSRAICWLLDTDVSHIVFSFDNDKWLVHSNLIGVNLRLYKKFMIKHDPEIIDVVRYDNLTLQQEEEVFQSLLEKTDEDGYDYLGFMYFAWRAILLKTFHVPLPDKNPYGRINMHLCTEMVNALPVWITRISNKIDFGITPPKKVIQILKEAKR
jgi:hypothetical protein